MVIKMAAFLHIMAVFYTANGAMFCAKNSKPEKHGTPMLSSIAGKR